MIENITYGKAKLSDSLEFQYFLKPFTFKPMKAKESLLNLQTL